MNVEKVLKTVRWFLPFYLFTLLPLSSQAQVGDYRTDLAVGGSAGYMLSNVGFIPDVPQGNLGGFTAARKNMLFNPEESIDFNGNTGPFIQYTYARIQSILRKAKEQNITIPAALPANVKISVKETELIQKLNAFGVAVRQAGTDYSPSGICNYCYELTKEFNQFYHDFTILGETDENKKVFRLVLAQAVAKVVSLGMGLLGIEMPERM